MPSSPATPASPSRRTLLCTAAAASALPLLPTPAHAAPRAGRGTELILLGTSGGPVPMHGRAGIASALVVDGRAYLIDCGPGTFGRYAQAWLTAEQLEAIFVTHLHSDHLSDLYAPRAPRGISPPSGRRAARCGRSPRRSRHPARRT